MLTASGMETALGFSAGKKGGFALNLDNLARRSIIPRVGERWHGWRRGLAMILFDLGGDPEIAPDILRHADSAVTRRLYNAGITQAGAGLCENGVSSDQDP
jgi:hypothetical protein